MRSECKCSECRLACRRKPGWFLPGEAEKAATKMGLSLKQFFDRHLMVDYYDGDVPIFVLSPAIVGDQPGDMFPADPSGRCVFYDDGLCKIHGEGKPYECAHLSHGAPPEFDHKAVAGQWNAPEHQKQIADLLGREPAPLGDYDGGGILGMLGLGGYYDDCDESAE